MPYETSTKEIEVDDMLVEGEVYWASTFVQLNPEGFESYAPIAFHVKALHKRITIRVRPIPISMP